CVRDSDAIICEGERDNVAQVSGNRETECQRAGRCRTATSRDINKSRESRNLCRQAFVLDECVSLLEVVTDLEVATLGDDLLRNELTRGPIQTDDHEGKTFGSDDDFARVVCHDSLAGTVCNRE